MTVLHLIGLSYEYLIFIGTLGIMRNICTRLRVQEYTSTLTCSLQGTRTQLFIDNYTSSSVAGISVSIMVTCSLQHVQRDFMYWLHVHIGCMEQSSDFTCWLYVRVGCMYVLAASSTVTLRIGCMYLMVAFVQGLRNVWAASCTVRIHVQAASAASVALATSQLGLV